MDGTMDEGLPLPLAERISSRGWTLIDVALAMFLVSGSIVGIALGNHRGPNGDGWDVLRYLLAVAACVPLPLRRRYPNQVLGVMGLSVVALLILGAHGPVQVGVAFAMYSVAATSARRTSLAAAAGLIAAIVLAALAAAGRPEWGSMISTPPVILVGWLAGENTRTRRAYFRGVAERAAERERDSQERLLRAAADERLRIARELHDVVAHTMSVVAVRSGVARMVMDSQPEEARRALEIIETTSRRALQEMRLLVGVLRQGEDPVSELAPAPGLADVPGLVNEVGQAGVEVDLQVEGLARPLPPGVDVSAYRIVQEALTNVVRHAGPTRARLSIRYQPGWVELEVSDEGGRRAPVLATALARGQGMGGGPGAGSGAWLVAGVGAGSGAWSGAGAGAGSGAWSGAGAGAGSGAGSGAGPGPGPGAGVGPSAGPGAGAGPSSGPGSGSVSGVGVGSESGSGSGHGLVGMRERVALFGGEILAGPSGQGFRVLARVPTDDSVR